MNKMMNEQPGTSSEKIHSERSSTGIKDKKTSKKQVQPEEISDESESEEDTR